MANVYLAARLRRSPEMRSTRLQLNEMGHVVTSRWIDANEGDGHSDNHLSDADRRMIAARNAEDINDCDVMIGWVESTVRGLLVEVGIAWALGKRVILVGDPREVTPTIELPGVLVVGNFYEAYAKL